MTLQETIQAMNFYKGKLYNGIFNDKIGAFDIAISALEKQIPKKPIKTKSEIVCPTCRTLVGSNPYCKYCGQALD